MFCVPFTAVIACRRVGDVSDFQVGLRADKASRAVFLGRLMRGRGKSGGFLAGPYEAGGRCAILLRRFVYRAAADTSRRRSRSGRYRPLRLRRRTKCREVRRISGGPPCILSGAEAAAAGNGRCGFGAGLYQPPLCTQNAEVKLHIVRPPHTVPPKSRPICPVRA